MKGSFQIISLTIFIILALFGVFVFSGAIPIGKGNSQGGQGTVVLWGTVRTEVMAPLLEEFNTLNPTYIVRYVQKSPTTFDQDLLEALADGNGPDMFFLPDDLVYHYSNKIFTIPYETYPQATFKNIFVSAGEVFLNGRGVSAIPLSVDPLVMYYNRSILDANSVVYPPVYWDEFDKLSPILTKKNESNRIIKSAVALGDFSNVSHAKDILTTLFMQAGNPIIREEGGNFSSTLNSINSKYNLPSVLKFYTDFADPSKGVYTWNKSFPDSSTAFSAENVALYFGYASELASLVSRNPNQDFLPAPVPQIRDSSTKLTSARVLGVALLSSSKNFNTAYIAAIQMATTDFAYKFSNALGVAPARRDLLAQRQTDSYSPIFYDSALFARSWLDPAPTNTNDIFRRMVENVLSNKLTPTEAISDADSKMGLLLLK